MAFRKKYRIRESFGNIEPHEVFLDTFAKSKEEEYGINEQKFEVQIKERLIYALFGLFLLSAGILFSKTFYLQIFQGNYLHSLSENNKGKINLVRAERGIIYDTNGKKLVTNSPAYDLICDKRSFTNLDPDTIKKIESMAGILGRTPLELQDEIQKSNDTEVVMSENISQQTLLVLEARINEFTGCQVEKNTVRNYAFGSIFSHVLGYTGKISKDDLVNSSTYTASDYVGKTGLENYYESELRGVPGKTEIIKNATGITKGTQVLSQPKSGDNLVLNIDADLQKVVYDSLAKSIKNLGAKKGAAVALNPKTGAVLALVSYPSYDNNIFSKGISQADYNALISDPNQPFFDRVINAKYPTGSTIKPFLASGALQENLINPNKIINDPGYILVKSQNDPSVVYKFAGVVPHGLVDMRKAIAVSSNIYFYTIGGGYEDQKGLGPAGIKKYLDIYGWEQKTGIDLPGEFKGFVPSPTWKLQTKKEQWWDGDTYNLSIGQSDLQVTPLQVAVAYCAIANGGTLYKPQIVQKIVDNSGDTPVTVQEFKPEVAGTINIDQKNLQVVREGMRDGVRESYGSSVMLNDLPVAVAGKTGTAETGKAGFYNTWSSNFAPYDNPEIVFVTTIEGVEGLRAATLPVAHDVLQYYFSR
jgi:penicillin-binding protein 2